MKKEEIRAVVFDIGGVLALGENSKFDGKKFQLSGVHVDIAKSLKISLDQWLDAIDTNYALAIEGKISEKKVLEIFSKNTKTPTRKLKKIVINSYKKHFCQNIELYKQAFKLRKLGYKIAILSDQWPLSEEALMLKKYTKNFDKVLVSWRVGLRKPSTKIYKLLLKELKTKPQETLFIDNQEWNTKPAEKLKIKTVLFKNNKQLFKHPLWKRLW